MKHAFITYLSPYVQYDVNFLHMLCSTNFLNQCLSDVSQYASSISFWILSLTHLTVMAALYPLHPCLLSGRSVLAGLEAAEDEQRASLL